MKTIYLHIVAFFKNVSNTLDYNRKVKETIKELNKLSNRELNDIGIARGDIYHIARTSYNKPAKVKVENKTFVFENDNLKGWV